jgi:hypothetical protein
MPRRSHEDGKVQPRSQEDSKHALILLATAIGGAAAAAELPYLLFVFEELESLTGLAVLVSGEFLLLSAWLSARARTVSEIAMLLPGALFGIAMAITGDSAYDWFVNGVDRNLFPFEIALMAALALPGGLIGAIAGSLIGRRRRAGRRARAPTPPRTAT